MSSKVITDFATSDARKQQEQHLHELWPGDEEYRRSHRSQLDLAGLTLVALKKVILDVATRKSLIDAVPDQGGNSRAELHLLEQQLHGWFAMLYAASRLVNTLQSESFLLDVLLDYPNRVDLQWYRLSQLKDPRVTMDLLAAEQYADLETKSMLQQCHEWALAQLSRLGQVPDIQEPIIAPESPTPEVATSIEPHTPYAQSENSAALMMFGFKAGLKTTDMVLQFQPVFGNYRLMKVPPESSVVFPHLFVRANSRQEITEISAETNEIMTQPDGTELRQRWEDYRHLLCTVFGNGDVTDFVMNTAKSQQVNWLKHLKQELNEDRKSVV